MDTGTETVMLQVRLPRELVRQVDHLSIDLDLSRPAMVQRLIEVAFAERDRAKPTTAVLQ